MDRTTSTSIGGWRLAGTYRTTSGFPISSFNGRLWPTNWNIPSEGHKLQLRWEVFNVTNTARFDPQSLDLDVTDELTFGRYTATLSPPRVM